MNIKPLLLALSLSLTYVALTEAAEQIVVPGGLANTEGNSASADLFRTSATTFQHVFAASEFAFLGAATGRIDGISFRLDGDTGQGFTGIWPGISLILSTTAQSPDSLSPHFGDNAGPDSVEVYGGVLGIFAQGGTSPRLFQITIPFTTPFFYDPSRGNLSMIFFTSPGSVSIELDAQLAADDSVGRVFGDGLNGAVDTLGLVTRFDVTPVPEPSTIVLFLISAVVVLPVLLKHAKHRFF